MPYKAYYKLMLKLVALILSQKIFIYKNTRKGWAVHLFKYLKLFILYLNQNMI